MNKIKKFNTELALEDVQKMINSVLSARHIEHMPLWTDDNLCYDAIDNGVGIDYNWNTDELYLAWESSGNKFSGNFQMNTYPNDADAVAKIHKDANEVLEGLLTKCQDLIEKCATVKKLKKLDEGTSAKITFQNWNRRISFNDFKGVNLDNICEVDVILNWKQMTYTGRIDKTNEVVWLSKKYKDEIIQITTDTDNEVDYDVDELPFVKKKYSSLPF